MTLAVNNASYTGQPPTPAQVQAFMRATKLAELLANAPDAKTIYSTLICARLSIDEATLKAQCDAAGITYAQLPPP